MNTDAPTAYAFIGNANADPNDLLAQWPDRAREAGHEPTGDPHITKNSTTGEYLVEGPIA